MRVLIDTTYERRAPLSGTGIYIRRLCEELGNLDGVDPVPVANTSRRSPAGGGTGSLHNLAADLRWTILELPRLARRNRAELIHHPLPSLVPLSGVPQATTVVDLAFERLPDLFDPRFRHYAHLTHRAAARAARAVICISETTAADARALWRVRAERIVVASLGPGQELEPGRPRAQEPTHFLYVGDAEPRKNLPVLIEAYRIYRASTPAPLELVLAGSAPGSGPGIRRVEKPTPATLTELYLDAAALVHPSLYEGFGLTPVEAMSLGTPVICARAPGLVETCGDAVRYADPHDPQAFAEGMRELAHDHAVRDALAQRGRRRACAFSWARCAIAHRDAYSLAVGA